MGIQKLNAHIARLAESDLVLVENEKLKKENQQVLAEKEKAQRIFAEAEKKAENANVVLMNAKAQGSMSHVSHIYTMINH